MQQGKCRVLLVEDSILTVEQLCESVSTLRPDISCASVATEKRAIEEIEHLPPHVVVLDLHLKQGTGFNVLRKLSTFPSVEKPLVIVLTNYALPQYRDFALLTGADYFLDKAVSIDAVPEILETFLRSDQRFNANHRGPNDGPVLAAD